MDKNRIQAEYRQSLNKLNKDKEDYLESLRLHKLEN
jgi:hypothetical protein